MKCNKNPIARKNKETNKENRIKRRKDKCKKWENRIKVERA